MALEILGYTMCRVRLWWLVSLPLEVSKLVFVWLEGSGAIFWIFHGEGSNHTLQLPYSDDFSFECRKLPFEGLAHTPLTVKSSIKILVEIKHRKK